MYIHVCYLPMYMYLSLSPSLSLSLSISLSLSLSPDIDECQLNGTALCDTEVTGRNCTNTVGSYDCQCLDGFHFNQDQKMCEGWTVHAQIKRNFLHSHSSTVYFEQLVYPRSTLYYVLLFTLLSLSRY